MTSLSQRIIRRIRNMKKDDIIIITERCHRTLINQCADKAWKKVRVWKNPDGEGYKVVCE